MNLSQKIPIGYGTVAGTLLTLAQLAGGIVLLLAGKTVQEKDAGRELLTTGSPLTGLATIAGRMIQGAAQVHGEAQLPTDEDELAAPPPEIPPAALQSVPAADVPPPVAPAEIPAA